MYDFSDKTKFNLWWNSSDGQSSMYIGSYESIEEATAAIPSAELWLRDECSETPLDKESFFTIELREKPMSLRIK